MVRFRRSKENQKQKKAIIKSLSKRDEIKDITTLFLNILSVPQLKGIDVMIDGLTQSQLKRVCNLNFRAGKLSVKPSADFNYNAYAYFRMPNGKEATSCFENETPWTEQMVSLFHEGPDALYKRLSSKKNKFLKIKGEKYHQTRRTSIMTYYDLTIESSDPLGVMIERLVKFYDAFELRRCCNLIRRQKIVFTLTKDQFDCIGKLTINAMLGSFYPYSLKSKNFSGYRVSFTQFFKSKLELPHAVNFMFEIPDEVLKEYCYRNNRGKFRKRSRYNKNIIDIDRIYLSEIMVKYDIRKELKESKYEDWPFVYRDWIKTVTTIFHI